MKYFRLRKANNPNNPMSDSFRMEEEDWMYFPERLKEETHKHSTHNPVDNDGEFDPSAQPFAMNPGNQVQFMGDTPTTIGTSEDVYNLEEHLQKRIDYWLNNHLEDVGPILMDHLQFLKQEPEDDLMNQQCDYDNISLYELSTCVEGDTSERRFEEDRFEEEEPLYTEDPFGLMVDNLYQRKRNPYDPLDPTTLEAEESETYENNKKTKKDPKNIVFPPYTYPMENIDSGIPYAEQAPINSYPGLL